MLMINLSAQGECTLDLPGSVTRASLKVELSYLVDGLRLFTIDSAQTTHHIEESSEVDVIYSPFLYH